MQLIAITSWFKLSFNSPGKFYIRKHTVAAIWIAWTEQWLPGRTNLGFAQKAEREEISCYYIKHTIQHNYMFVHCVCVGFLSSVALTSCIKKSFSLNGRSSVAHHSILEESINHTYNIKVKTHETAIFVTACLVAKRVNLFSKTLMKRKWLGSV